MGGGVRGPEAPGLQAKPAGASGPGPLGLTEDQTIPEGFAVVIPQHKGGKLNAVGGWNARLNDCHKFAALLLDGMQVPGLLTLTADREALKDPLAGHRRMVKQFSELMRQLGIVVWARVFEFQLESGEGWTHLHVIFDVAGTPWDQSRLKGRPFINLRGLRAAIMRRWCGRWGVGGIGGQDLQPVRHRGKTGTYLAKYLAKPLEAVPPWVLDQKLVRMVGFSRQAGLLLRDLGLAAVRPKVKRRRAVKKRELSPIVERLASSGQCSKVVGSAGYLGELKAPWEELMVRRAEWESQSGAQFAIGTRTWTRKLRGGGVITRTKAVLLMQAPTGELIERLNDVLACSDVPERCQEEYQLRLVQLRNSWSEMQDRKSHGV